MRKISMFTVFTAIVLASLSSCIDHELVYKTIDFEDVTLNPDSILKTSSFNSNKLGFQNNYADYGFYTSWSGFACSAKKDMQTAGYLNDLSVYATIAASGNKFGVFYFSSWDPTAYCSFSNNEEYLIKDLKLTNSTFAYLSMKNGQGPAKKFTSGDWFKVTIHGYNKWGIQKDSVEFYLADFRNGKSYICDSWTTVHVAKLGRVNKLTFTFSSSDNDPTYGMNTPAYVCIDDICYVLGEERDLE